MPDETVALKEYLEALIKAQREFFCEKMAANALAVDLARQEYRREVEHLNALRESVEEDRGHFVQNSQYQERHEMLRREIESLKLESARSEARAKTWATVVGLGIGILSIALHFMK